MFVEEGGEYCNKVLGVAVYVSRARHIESVIHPIINGIPENMVWSPNPSFVERRRVIPVEIPGPRGVWRT